MIIQVNIVICNHCILLFLHKSTTNYYYWNLRINWQSVALLTRGWGKLETRPPVALGSSSALFTFTMSLAPLPGELENCARHAFKMAPRHHAFPQKRDSEAQPIWIDILVSHRCWQASKVGSRMEVEWRTATWFCSLPSHSEGVENKSLSRRRCIVVDYLNKFEIYLPIWSRGPLHKIVVVRNIRFIRQKCEICDLVFWTWIMMFSVESHTYEVSGHLCHYMTFNHICDLRRYEI